MLFPLQDMLLDRYEIIEVKFSIQLNASFCLQLTQPSKLHKRVTLQDLQKHLGTTTQVRYGLNKKPQYADIVGLEGRWLFR